jgi:hypothetical protein
MILARCDMVLEKVASGTCPALGAFRRQAAASVAIR